MEKFRKFGVGQAAQHHRSYAAKYNMDIVVMVYDPRGQILWSSGMHSSCSTCRCNVKSGTEAAAQCVEPNPPALPCPALPCPPQDGGVVTPRTLSTRVIISLGDNKHSCQLTNTPLTLADTAPLY